MWSRADDCVLQWSQVAGMESHTKTLPEKDMMKLAGQAQHLRHYLDAAVPSGTPDMLHPADMAEYGFDNAGELLDMCSAVSTTECVGGLVLTGSQVRRQLVHARYGRH